MPPQKRTTPRKQAPTPPPAPEPTEQPDQPSETPPAASETPDQPPAAQEPASAPEKAVEQPSEPHTTSWTTDKYGNATDGSSTVPVRPIQPGMKYFPFEYDDKGDFVVAKEDVFASVQYMGSNREGRVYAYYKGNFVPKAVLDNLVEKKDDGEG